MERYSIGLVMFMICLVIIGASAEENLSSVDSNNSNILASEVLNSAMYEIIDVKKDLFLSAKEKRIRIKLLLEEFVDLEYIYKHAPEGVMKAHSFNEFKKMTFDNNELLNLDYNGEKITFDYRSPVYVRKGIFEFNLLKNKVELVVRVRGYAIDHLLHFFMHKTAQTWKVYKYVYGVEFPEDKIRHIIIRFDNYALS